MAATGSSNYVTVGTDAAAVEIIQHFDKVKVFFFLQIPWILKPDYYTKEH
jgi:hypothetical protein